MRKIAQQLNLENIPTKKKNGKWGINAVNAILSRPIYTEATTKIYDYFNKLGSNITNDIEYFDGTMTANLYGKTKKNVKVKAIRKYDEMFLSLINCVPLISNEDWFKAQKIKGVKKVLPPRSNTSKISFLCGLVKCGKCSSNMVTQGCRNRYGIKYNYLICTTKKNIGKEKCDNKMIDTSKLEDIVISDIKKHFNSKNISNKIDKYLKNTKKNNTKLLKHKEELENEIIKIDIQIENLINSIANGSEVITKYINQKIETLEEEKKYLLFEQKELNETNTLSGDAFLIEYVKNINEKINTTDFEQLKLLCKTVIDKIVITDENIDIHYKI